jgi:hypothetical protein
MLTRIKLGPKLMTPARGFSRAEARVIQSEYQTLIDGILAGCRDNPVSPDTDYITAIDEIAETREDEFKKILQGKHTKRGGEELPGDLMLDGILRLAQAYFRKENPFYFSNDTFTGPLTLSFNLSAAAPDAVLTMALKADNGSVDDARDIVMGEDSMLRRAFAAYWEHLSKAPAGMGDRPEVMAQFDQARHDIHDNTKFPYMEIGDSLSKMGFEAGGRLTEMLFTLVAIAYPDTRNPFPEMTLEAHRVSAQRAGKVLRI